MCAKCLRATPVLARKLAFDRLSYTGEVRYSVNGLKFAKTLK